MRTRIQAAAFPFEIGEFADDLRRIFHELDRQSAGDPVAGECAPPVDVVESDEALDIALDVPGVEPTSIRVVAKGDTLLMAGEKRRHPTGRESTFHLVERDFGRFARTVRLGRACDASQTKATLVDGVLRVIVPKIADRRGRRIDIPITGVHDVTS